MKTALVLGAGGFIGSHMVKRLKSERYWVRGVDIKYPEFSKTVADEFVIYDLRISKNMEAVVRLQSTGGYGNDKFSYYKQPFATDKPFDEVYQFAADMGGAGYVFSGDNDADIMSNSAMINLLCAEYCRFYDVGKVFYSSSACMYPQEIQNRNKHGVVVDCSLRESDAYPANPDSEYGWEKLFSERLYMAYVRNFNMNVRIARFHNIYGPEGTYKGGKEKAPAAMCRKVVESDGEIEIWGDGDQTRSFLYIDDCIDAVRLLMQSDFREPINIGSEEMVTINHLANLAISNSGKTIHKKHIDGPTGVRGRNSNNDLIRKVLGWEPKVSLSEGMEKTFNWILSQYASQYARNI